MKHCFANIFFVSKLSAPHQAKTTPVPEALQASRIASTMASMTGCQKRVCSWRTAESLQIGCWLWGGGVEVVGGGGGGCGAVGWR